jgi:hypothetical protein
MIKSTLQDSQPVQVWNNALQSKALPFALIMTSFFFFKKKQCLLRIRLKKYLENTSVQLYSRILFLYITIKEIAVASQKPNYYIGAGKILNLLASCACARARAGGDTTYKKKKKKNVEMKRKKEILYSVI